MSQKRRIELFRIGAGAVARIFGVDGCYVCPICSRAFGEVAAESGELTLEHVPPRSVGGRGIALTCRDCNSTAGHTAEAALHAREENRRFMEFMRGRRDRYESHVALDVGGETIRARLARDADAGATKFQILGETNDPKVVRKVSEHMTGLAKQGDATGEEIRVSSGVMYDPRLAKVAELKSAFLAAFAAFGYRYAFSRVLLPVRQQIMEPDQEVLTDPWTVALGIDDEFMLVLVPEPDCLVVKLGTSGVVLPWVTSPEEVLRGVKARSGEDGVMQVMGTRVEWPTKLELVLDGGGEEGGGEG